MYYVKVKKQPPVKPFDGTHAPVDEPQFEIIRFSSLNAAQQTAARLAEARSLN